MPKGRRYNKRRPLTRQQYKAVAKVANKQIHKASELHTIDDNVAALSLTTCVGTSPAAVEFPVQGMGSNQRIGDSVYLKGLQTRFILSNEGNVDLMIRSIWFQWMEPDSTPTMADILQNSTAANGAITSYYVVNPTKKFKILHDSVQVFDSNPSSNGHRIVRDTFSGKDLVIHKPDFTGTASQNCTGRIWYAFFSDQLTTGVVAGLQTRLRYFDN